MISSDKAKITYPCNWTYKIISTEKNLILEAVASVIKSRNYTLQDSNSSKTGKYISLELNLSVKSEDDRNGIYKQLVDHKDIKMVI